MGHPARARSTRSRGPATLVTFIGDPKQAIYAFRGADVVSYLRPSRPPARATARRRTGAATSRWSAPWTPCSAAPRWATSRSSCRRSSPPTRPRGSSARPGRRRSGCGCVPRAGLRAHWKTGLPMVGPVRERVAADLAADVAELVAADSRWEDGREDPSLGPGDVAVLVRTNAQAGLVREALAVAGVPSVLAGATSVFATESAEEWLALLEAVEQPGRTGRVRAAALTVFLGHAATDLDAHADAVLPEVGAMLRRWGAALHDRGVAAFLEAVAAETGLAARVLARVDGERRITDIRHIGQVLHAAAVESRLGVVALVEWLRARMAEAAAGTGELRPERSRRLESDASAVQVLTVHKCKGLEFPVVYVPFGWDRWVVRRPRPSSPTTTRTAGGCATVGGQDDPAWRRARRRGPRRGRRRGPAPALRRADPRAGPGRVLVGARDHHRELRGAAPVPRAARAGHEPRTARTRWSRTSAVLAELQRAGRGTTSPSSGSSRARRRPSSRPRVAPHALAAAPFDRPLDTRLAAHVVLLAHRRARTRGAPRAASRGSARSLDEDDPDDAAAPAPGRGRARSAVADGGPARRGGVRHARARRARDRRHRRRRPARRARRLGHRGAAAPPARRRRRRRRSPTRCCR